MEEKKMTKAEYFEAIKAVVEAAGETELAEFCDAQIAQLANKAEKAKEAAAKRRAESDEIRKIVLANVTNEWATAQDIADAIGDEEISKNKVVPRLTALVNDGAIVKDTAKAENGKKVTVYKLA